jgi:hypothetical protein
LGHRGFSLTLDEKRMAKQGNNSFEKTAFIIEILSLSA